MRVLFLLAHADPRVAPSYQAALGPDVEVVPFVAPGPGLSSAYEKLAAYLRRGRAGTPLLSTLLAHLGVGPTDHYDAIVMAWYSAAYALARGLAASPEDRAAIAGWVGIDGGHTSLDADGTANDDGVAWLVGLAGDAARGETVLVYGASDVVPGLYASTRQTIDEALRLADVALVLRQEPCGGCRSGEMRVREAATLRVEAHDHRVDPVQEHADALRAWGDELAARAVAMVRERKAAKTPLEQIGQIEGCAGENVNDYALNARSSTSRPQGLGEHALAHALRELAASAAEEPPGSNGGPRVAAYFSGCIRDGRPLRIRSGAWCAAFVGWCDSKARGEMRLEGLDAEPPCRWRASVAELIADAIAAGAWRRAGEYSPLRGDLAVFRRDGQDPRNGGHGHVGRVETAPDENGRYPTIDGNSGHDGARVARNERSIADTDLIGFISYLRGA